jgi:leucine dehydrogenase
VAAPAAPASPSTQRRSDIVGAIERYLATLDHEELLVRRGRRSGTYSIVAIHSTARGPALGGCRMLAYEDSRDAMRDAMRLSRAMTLKSAVAGLPLGGGKGVIMLRPGDSLSRTRRRQALTDFAETIEMLGGRYITAEDVGTSSSDMQAIASVTRHVTGLARSKGGSGDPSPFTALGVEAAIRVSCERAFGTSTLKGRRIAIVGLGHVGARVASRCSRAGARLVVADVNPAKEAVAKRLGARWLTPDRAFEADVDVFAPCALGGILTYDSVPRLRCAVVAGAANNQLADDGVADLLGARDILWAPDFVANAGGIINIAVELEGYDPALARRRVRGIGDTLRTIFDEAAALGATPLTAALELARRRMAEAGQDLASAGPR